jgi:hypothetical protein
MTSSFQNNESGWIMKKAYCWAIVIIILFVGTAHAADPMRRQIRTALPETITTIGPAAQYYADVIGYRLLTGYPAPEECERIARRTINILADKNRILPVEEAILALLDRNCKLVIDHEHKLFAFEEDRGRK